jgi:hypothetical protein
MKALYEVHSFNFLSWTQKSKPFHDMIGEGSIHVSKQNTLCSNRRAHDPWRMTMCSLWRNTLYSLEIYAPLFLFGMPLLSLVKPKTNQVDRRNTFNKCTPYKSVILRWYGLINQWHSNTRKMSSQNALSSKYLYESHKCTWHPFYPNLRDIKRLW